MDPALAAIQDAIEALHDAMELIADPALTNTVSTCYSQLQGVQQKMMAAPGQGGGPPQAGPGGYGGQAGPGAGADPRAALLAQLAG